MFYSVYSLIFAIYSLSCVSRAYKAVCFAKHIFFYISLKRKKNCFVVPFWTNYEEIRSPLRSLLLSLVSLLLFIRMVKQKKQPKNDLADDLFFKDGTTVLWILFMCIDFVVGFVMVLFELSCCTMDACVYYNIFSAFYFITILLSCLFVSVLCFN